MIFANSLDLDQAQQNVEPDLDPNCLTLLLCGAVYKPMAQLGLIFFWNYGGKSLATNSLIILYIL